MPASGVTGTASPFFIPRENSFDIIEPGNCYLYVKVVSAQAVYKGRFWEKVNNLVITSDVFIKHPEIKTNPVFNIQKIVEIKKNTSQLLGISSNLIGLVPATMDSFHFSIEFVLDKENKLKELHPLINENVFQKAADFLPGASLATGILSDVSKKIFTAFVDKKTRRPILQIDADFNITHGGMREGYYVILSSLDRKRPLPEPLSDLSIKDNRLMIGGKFAEMWNYIIIDLRKIRTKSRFLHNNSLWERKFCDAEVIAQNIHLNPLSDISEKDEAWKQCLALLKDGQLLLSYDISYLRSEAESMIKVVYQKCFSLIYSEHQSSGIKFRGSLSGNQLFNYGRDLLNIGLEEDIVNSNLQYLKKCEDDLTTIKNEGLDK